MLIIAYHFVYGKKKYKTRKELALKIQELYSLYISSYNTRIGNYLVTRFNMSLLNPKYTEESMLSESIDLLHEIIFNPNQKNNKLDSNLFKIIKKDILTEIETVKEMYATKAFLACLLIEHAEEFEGNSRV